MAIPTYGRDGVLLETINHLLAQVPPADELIIVDQTAHHEPEVEATLLDLHAAGRIRWLHQSTPNLPRARNRALQETSCDVVIFVDDDVIPQPAFVAAHAINYLDPGLVAVAGRAEQRLGWATARRKSSWPIRQDYRYLRLDGLERVEPVANFAGCNHSVRRSEMLRIGGYDENYIGWAYREDSDAALRLWAAGGKIAFDPLAALYHLASPSGGCRITDTISAQAEWTIPFPSVYFTFRHEAMSLCGLADLFLRNPRRYVLRKANITHPWRLPVAVVGYLYAAVRAAWAARSRMLEEGNHHWDEVVLGPDRHRSAW